MDKVKLEIKTPTNKIIEHNGINIEIIPLLNLSQQVFLIEEYIKYYFGNPEEILIENTRYHYLEAEYKLRNYVIRLITNIELTQDIVNDVLVDVILWEKITSEIENWSYFKYMLETVVYDIKQEEILENSVGKVISDLVKKGYALLDKFSSMSPEELTKAGEKGLELIERLEKTSVLRNPADAIAITKGPVSEAIGNVINEKKKRARIKK